MPGGKALYPPNICRDNNPSKHHNEWSEALFIHSLFREPHFIIPQKKTLWQVPGVAIIDYHKWVKKKKFILLLFSKLTRSWKNRCCQSWPLLKLWEDPFHTSLWALWLPVTGLLWVLRVIPVPVLMGPSSLCACASPHFFKETSQWSWVHPSLVWL